MKYLRTSIQEIETAAELQKINGYSIAPFFAVGVVLVAVDQLFCQTCN